MGRKTLLESIPAAWCQGDEAMAEKVATAVAAEMARNADQKIVAVPFEEVA